MRFQPLPITGAFLVVLDPISDNRGYFARAYCQRQFIDHGLSERVAQCNVSYNIHKYTLRGMHYQLDPWGEAKYIRCLWGSIYDVFIDLRGNSPTKYQWYGIPISEEGMTAVYIPAGCAHGFMTLEANTTVYYQSSEFYTPGSERGIRYNDPFFNVTWPARPAVISDKDAGWEDFKA